MQETSACISSIRTLLAAILHMLENYAFQHFNSNNNLKILRLERAPVHFAHTVHGSLNVNFPGRRVGRGHWNVQRATDSAQYEVLDI